MAGGGSATLFSDLALVLLAAGATALIFYYLKQPVVLGYLLAGFLVGPLGPFPLVSGEGEVLTFLGELGIVFLLFALGLEFSLSKLRRVGATAVIAGTIEIALMLGLGYLIGRAVGWTPMESVFLGAVISISSTTIIVKVLAERGEKDEEWAQLTLGILIMEDVLAVLILTGLSSAAASESFDPALLLDLVYKLGIFLGAAVVAGYLMAPRIVARLTALEVEEVIVVLAVSIGFGMALLAAKLGFSAGLGAFIAGALMAEGAGVKEIEHRVAPLRDVFTAIFFVTVGAALAFSDITANIGLILAVTAIVLLGKTMSVALATFITGKPPGTAIRVGMGMANIGEFGFIIAALGVSLAVAPPGLYPIAVAACAITAFIAPWAMRFSPKFAAWLGRRAPSGVHAYAATYGTWIARMGRSDRADPEWRKVKRAVVVALLMAAVIVAIFAGGALAEDDIAHALGSRIQISIPFMSITWLALSLLAAPFVLVWIREMRVMVRALARLAVPMRLRGAQPTTPELLLRRTFGVAVAGLTAAFIVVFGSLFVPNIIAVAAVAAGGVLISSVFLGRALGGFHREVEATIERVMRDDDLAQQATREEAMRIVEESKAWGAGSREVVLPGVSGGGGRTIGQLRLRELTGASIVTVRRENERDILSPGPTLRFAASDRVLLVGDDEALTRAEEILLGKDLGVSGGATEIEVQPSWSSVGRTLGELEMERATGATILVVLRDGQALAPDAALEIRAGDRLVVSGTTVEVARVEAKVK